MKNVVCNHTHGPWKFVAPHYIGTDEEDSQTIAYLDNHRNRKARSKQEEVANGVLIAMAPLLLSALRYCLEYLLANVDEYSAPRARAAKMVIHKITGEYPETENEDVGETQSLLCE